MASWIKTVPDPGGLSDYVQIAAIQNVGVRPHFTNSGADGTFDLVVYVAGGSSFIIKEGYNTYQAAQAALDTDITQAGGGISL